MIRVDLSHMRHFIPLPYEAALTPRLHLAHERLRSGTGTGSGRARTSRNSPTSRPGWRG